MMDKVRSAEHFRQEMAFSTKPIVCGVSQVERVSPFLQNTDHFMWVETLVQDYENKQLNIISTKPLMQVAWPGDRLDCDGNSIPVNHQFHPKRNAQSCTIPLLTVYWCAAHCSLQPALPDSSVLLNPMLGRGGRIDLVHFDLTQHANLIFQRELHTAHK